MICSKCHNEIVGYSYYRIGKFFTNYVCENCGSFNNILTELEIRSIKIEK